MKMKKVLNFVLRLSIGLIILALLIDYVGFGRVYDTLVSMNLYYLPLIILIFILNFIIGAMNIKIFIDPLKHKLGFWKIFKYSFFSWSVGLFIPGKIGEFSLIYFLKKDKIPMGESLVIAILDKVITLIVLVIISSFFFFFFSNQMKGFLFFFFFFILIASFFLLVLSPDIRGMIKRYILKKHSKLFKGFSKTFIYYLKNKKKIIFINFLLTFLKWITASLIIFFLFKSFSQSINFFNVFIINATIIIISLIPLSISGLGTMELSAIFFYQHVGISNDITFTVYLAARLLSYLFAAISLFLYKH